MKKAWKIEEANEEKILYMSVPSKKQEWGDIVYGKTHLVSIYHQE